MRISGGTSHRANRKVQTETGDLPRLPGLRSCRRTRAGPRGGVPPPDARRHGAVTTPGSLLARPGAPARPVCRRGAGRPCLLAGAGGAVQRADIDRRAGRSGAGRRGAGAGAGRGGARARRPPVRLGAAFARSSPVPALRRAGVSPRAPGGGGEPRAARPRADAAAARSRSAPHPAPAAERRRRRARSQAAQPPPAPRLRPLFLWASQVDGAVQRVRCEDYDPRNRIHLTRTKNGWRAFPKTVTFDAIRRGVTPLSQPPPSPPPPPAPRDRRRRRCGRPSRRQRPKSSSAWLEPDLESHIPSHRIAVPRVPPQPPTTPPSSSPLPSDPSPVSSPAPDSPSHSPPGSPPTLRGSPQPRLPPTPPSRTPPTSTTAPSPIPPAAVPPPPQPPEPTPLDSLLAVAELEFHQQRGSELEMELRAEAGARFAFLPPEETPSALFDLGDGKVSDAEDAFRELGAHDDLFESISEAHYLPELGGHDEALLESLVEKGCEDNQILGRLDRLTAQLATGAEYEEDTLLGGAPVADIIDRLESLESPSRSAAQGLLHLARRPSVVDPFVPDEVFAQEPQEACEPAPSDPERRLASDGGPADVMYTEQVPGLPDAFDYEDYDIAQPSEMTPAPDQNDATSSEEAPLVPTEISNTMQQKAETDVNDLTDIKLDILESDIEGIEFKLEDLEPLKKEENKEEVEKATDLSAVLEIDDTEDNAALAMPTTELPRVNTLESLAFTENVAPNKIHNIPKDLSIHRRLSSSSSSYTSPRRIEIPRAPSTESDSMQSPQPSGIPAISSPEVFNTPTTKSKQPSFLESLYGATSPKMYTSEVSIQPCFPLYLGKHRKSASPTVSSCSDEIRNVNKDIGEPQEKRVRRESHDLAKICNLLKKCGENKLAEANKKKLSEIERLPPLKQLELLKSNKNFNLPDHMLVPRDRINKIIAAPGKEIPALLMERPQLNMPEILQDPNFIGDPELMVISLEQLRQLIIHSVKSYDKTKKPSETESSTENAKDNDKEPNTKSTSKNSDHNKPSSSVRTPTPSTGTPQPPPEQTAAQPRPIPSMGHLADDIDAANSAAAYQMSWLPAYLSHFNQMSQLEAVAACSQNAEFLKALSSSGAYANSNYANLTQMFHPSRFMNLPNLPNFPMMPPMDYESRMQLAMWQEAVNMSAAQAQRHKHAAAERSAATDALHKEASVPSDFVNPYAHFAKSQQHAPGKHSAARTSPIANNYSNSQRAHAHNHFMQSMYPGLGPAMRGAAPPNIQIPYYNPSGSQRSPRGSQSKSPTSPYYPNNNYLQSAKQAERGGRGGGGGQGSPRPRISVKSIEDLQHEASVAAHARRAAVPAAHAARRRDEPEVGSTTTAGEPPLLPPLMPPLMPPHPHDPAAFPIWHPLFSNQKGYTSPWSWTTVTATGD